MVEVKRHHMEAVDLDNSWRHSWVVSSQEVEVELESAMDQQEAELVHPGPTEVFKLIKGVAPQIVEFIHKLNIMVVRDLH